MEIVIDIPDEIYDFVQNTSFVEDESTLFKQTSAERQKTLVLFDILDAIRNGTPLPEHLNKIKDDIDKKISHYEHFSSSNTANGLMMAKEIIDKYIEGSDSE